MAFVSDKLITSIELIERYARARAGENWRFRTFVKHRLDWKDEEVDRVAQATGAEVAAAIDCTACAHCCRTLQIVVDAADMARLASRLGISVKEFRRKYVGKSEFGEECLNRQPCPFLAGSLCSVYEDRPRACRDFPYLQESGFRQRMLM